MDENNVNGFDNMDDEEGTTVLTSPGVSAFGGAQGTPPTNMTTPDQNANQAADQMNGQYGAQQYGDQTNGQYGQQYGDQANGQYGQQYGGQMNGQYGQQYGNQMNNQYGQQYGDQMNNQYGQQQYGGQMNGQYGQQQYGGQMNGQYGQQQYGGQMNGQYGGQQYGGQMGNNPFGKPAKKFSFGLDEFKNVKSFNDFIKNTKLMIMSGAALALIVILMVVIIVAAGGRGAGSIDKVGDKLAKAVRTENENTVYKLMNSKMFKAATEDVGETKKEALDDIKDLLEDDVDDLEDEVGKVKKIEVKDVDKDYASKSDIKDLKKEFKKEFDVDLDISGYAYAKADIIVEGEDGTVDGTLSYTAVKIGSKWYLAGDYSIYLNIDYDR